jgi:hypothetical protein
MSMAMESMTNNVFEDFIPFTIIMWPEFHKS